MAKSNSKKSTTKSAGKPAGKGSSKSTGKSKPAAKKPAAKKPVAKKLAALAVKTAKKASLPKLPASAKGRGGRGKPIAAAKSVTQRVKGSVSKAVGDSERAIVRAGAKTVRTTKAAAGSSVKSIVSTGKKVANAGRIVVQTAAGAAGGAASGTVKAVKNAAKDLAAPIGGKKTGGKRKPHSLMDDVKSIATHAVAGAAVGALTGAMKVAIPEMEQAAGIEKKD